MQTNRREPVENLSSEDRDRLRDIVSTLLPVGGEAQKNWLTNLLVGVDGHTLGLLIGGMLLAQTPEITTLSILQRLIESGGPCEGRAWLGYFLRRLAHSTPNGADRAFLLALFDRYQLDAAAPQAVPEGEASREVLEAVIGEDARRPFRTIQRYALAGPAVVCVYGPGGLGTGFLVADDLVMTCNHVLSANADAPAARAALGETLAKFNFQQEVDRDSLATPVTATATPDGAFHSAAPPLDYCVFSIDRTGLQSEFEAAGIAPRPLTLVDSLREGRVAAPRDRVVIIQHPGGDPKVIAYVNNFVQYADGQTLQYTTTTDKGSSGSPVLNEAGLVVAVHNKGGSIPVPGESGIRYLRNEGTTAHAILADLRANAADIVARLSIA